MNNVNYNEQCKLQWTMGITMYNVNYNTQCKLQYKLQWTM